MIRGSGLEASITRRATSSTRWTVEARYPVYFRFRGKAEADRRTFSAHGDANDATRTLRALRLRDPWNREAENPTARHAVRAGLQQAHPDRGGNECARRRRASAGVDLMAAFLSISATRRGKARR